MSSAPPPPPYDELLQARIEADRQAGRPIQKIPLIKHLREAAGLGLREAKDAVESFGTRRGIPELEPRTGTGCLPLVLAVALFAPLFGLLAHSGMGGQTW